MVGFPRQDANADIDPDMDPGIDTDADCTVRDETG
jgi:hypothetical protein